MLAFLSQKGCSPGSGRCVSGLRAAGQQRLGRRSGGLRRAVIGNDFFRTAGFPQGYPRCWKTNKVGKTWDKSGKKLAQGWDKVGTLFLEICGIMIASKNRETVRSTVSLLVYGVKFSKIGSQPSAVAVSNSSGVFTVQVTLCTFQSLRTRKLLSVRRSRKR